MVEDLGVLRVLQRFPGVVQTDIVVAAVVVAVVAAVVVAVGSIMVVRKDIF